MSSLQEVLALPDYNLNMKWPLRYRRISCLYNIDSPDC